jgi:hypothetical protein
LTRANESLAIVRFCFLNQPCLPVALRMVE